MEVRVLSAALFSAKLTAGIAYSLRLPLLFGSELDDLGWTALDVVGSEDLDSDEPPELSLDVAELAVGLPDLDSDDVDSDLLSDFNSDEFFESDAADFLYDSLR